MNDIADMIREIEKIEQAQRMIVEPPIDYFALIGEYALWYCALSYCIVPFFLICWNNWSKPQDRIDAFSTGLAFLFSPFTFLGFALWTIGVFLGGTRE